MPNTSSASSGFEVVIKPSVYLAAALIACAPEPAIYNGISVEGLVYNFAFLILKYFPINVRKPFSSISLSSLFADLSGSIVLFLFLFHNLFMI
jgi:hypothetical protein